MIQQAIIKINTEMQKAPNDKYLEAVGHHVIDAITTEANAKAVLNEKKDIAGAMAEVKGAARKMATNGVAVMADDDVYAIVDEYFGLTSASAASVPAPTSNKAVVLDIADFF